MIVCGNCGHQNEATDTFCGNCGRFLEWVGQKVAEPEPEALPAAEEGVAPVSEPGLIGRLRHAVGLEEAVDDGAPVEAGTSSAPEAPVASEVPPGVAPQPSAVPRQAPERGPERAEVRREPKPIEPEPEPPAQRTAPVAQTPPEPESTVEAAAGPDTEPAAEPAAAATAEPVAELPPQRPPPAPRRRGGPSRRAAATIQPTAADDSIADAAPTAPPDEPVDTPAPEPAIVQPVARRPTDLPPAPPPDLPVAAPAVAPAPVQPPPVQPVPVRPTQPAPRQPTPEIATPRPRPAADTPVRVAQPGDLICVKCSAPNDPSRRFCRRCGTTLAMAVPPVQEPWWRRIFRRTPRRYEAGERMRTMKSGGRPRRGLGTRFQFIIRWALAGLVLLGVVGYVAVPSVGSLINGGIRNVVNQLSRIVSPSLTLVHASTTASTTAVKNHPAEMVTDDISNNEWQGEGDDLVLTFTFERPIDLGGLNIWNGAVHPKTKAFRTDLRRPSQLLLETQSGQTATIDLDDIHEKQVRFIDLSGVETLEIRIVQTNGPADAPLALSEIEFLKKG